MRVTKLALLLLLSTTIAIPAAHAQKTPSPSAEKEAKKLYKQAETHFRLREYKEAITDLKKSYRLFPDPRFLYNIGYSYDKLEKYQDALSYYENYLREAPDADNRSEVEGRIQELQDILEKQKQEEENAKLVQENLNTMTGNSGLEDQIKPKKSIFKRWWFWTGLAAGVAAGTGAVVGSAVLAAPTKTDLGNQDLFD